MADADTKENTSQQNVGSTGDSGAVTAQLTQVQDELRKMNERMEAQSNALIESTRKKVVQEEVDENIYDPKVIERRMTAAFESKIRAEKAKDVTIWNLAQDYPEIQSDAKIRQAILEAQKELPEATRDTAGGYEHAVLKAVAKAGLIPKSKRPVVDEDTSISSRSSGQRPPKAKGKIDERTLMVAQLLGRDITDKKVLEGLEAASNRETYSKYR